MIQLRRNTFETNSSSSHSLVVTKTSTLLTHEEMLKDIKWNLDKDGLYYSCGRRYYGRSPFEVLVTFDQKMKYAFAHTLKPGSESYIKVVNAVHELVPEFNGMRHKEGDYWEYGTDDYCLWGWLDKLGITLKEFLQDSRYIVICDGDEYCVWDYMKEANLINTDIIERELL